MQVGIDIVDVERFKDFDRGKLEKMFTTRELNYAKNKNLETVAGLFCAKESFFKAIGTGLQISRLHEVEIIHDSLGAPHFEISQSLIKEHDLDSAKITLNISHTKTVAVAVCIILKLDSIILNKNVLR